MLYTLKNTINCAKSIIAYFTDKNATYSLGNNLDQASSIRQNQVILSQLVQIRVRQIVQLLYSTNLESI